MSEESLRRARKEIQARRDRAEWEAARREAEIKEAIPAAQPYLLCVSQTGSQIARILLAGGKETRARIEALAVENTNAQKQLALFLRENGYSEDYLDIPYTCRECGDTGYVNGEKCRCLRELAAQYAADEFHSDAHLDATAESMTFETFSLRYYEEAPIAGGGKAPRQTMGEILEFCGAYAERFSPHAPSVLMTGETGLGKTHLSLAIANRVMQKGWSAMYASSPDLFRRLQNEYYGKGEPGVDTMDALLTTQLVILDDLGAELENQFNVSALYNIVNSRLNAGRPTIINTNLSPKELERRYGGRVASRLMTLYRCLKFVGRDVRQQKLKNHEL